MTTWIVEYLLKDWMILKWRWYSKYFFPNYVYFTFINELFLNIFLSIHFLKSTKLIIRSFDITNFLLNHFFHCICSLVLWIKINFRDQYLIFHASACNDSCYNVDKMMLSYNVDIFWCVTCVVWTWIFKGVVPTSTCYMSFCNKSKE